MGIKRAEVIEVFNDLSLLTADKLDQLLGRSPEPSHLPRVASPDDVVKNMPRDSLRVRVIGDEFSIICYPFFPSHLRLPTKVGEEVWVFFEDFQQSSPTLFDPEKGTGKTGIKDVVMTSRNPSTTPSENITLGYWMCRPANERQVEDLNYTAFGRAKFASGFTMEKASDIQQNAGRASRTPSFPFYSDTSGRLEAVSKSDELLKKRIEPFFSNFTLEPVARYTKMPGETVIAGSNDARIVLGQTRSGRPARAGSESGSIDIVAGTGRDGTAPNTVANPYGQEVEKDPLLTGKQDIATEGDPDFRSDLSRLMVAENIAVDQSFPAAIPTIVSDTAEQTGPAVVARAQHVRVISSENGSVRIIVEGPTQSSIVIDSSGNAQINATNVALGNETTPQIVINGQTGNIMVTGSKVMLGTLSQNPGVTNGLLVGTNIYSVLLALRNDLVGSGATPPSPAGVVALPTTAAAMTALDPALSSLFSKTVFASS